ncbi:MAG: ProQ/FINO family protein, partial [Rubrivivax sp.]
MSEPSEASETSQAGDAAKPAELSPAACGRLLAERFPALFAGPGPVRPIKLRIQADIQARAPGVFSKRVLSVFLSRHTTGNAYLKALVQAPHRFDLDGQPAGEIAPEHREAAREELERRRAVHRAKAGPTGAAAQQPPRTPPQAGDRPAPAAGSSGPASGELAGPADRPGGPEGRAGRGARGGRDGRDGQRGPGGPSGPGRPGEHGGPGRPGRPGAPVGRGGRGGPGERARREGPAGQGGPGPGSPGPAAARGAPPQVEDPARRQRAQLL